MNLNRQIAETLVQIEIARDLATRYALAAHLCTIADRTTEVFGLAIQLRGMLANACVSAGISRRAVADAEAMKPDREHYNADCDAACMHISVKPGTDLEGTFEAFNHDDGEPVRINGWLWSFDAINISRH